MLMRVLRVLYLPNFNIHAHKRFTCVPFPVKPSCLFIAAEYGSSQARHVLYLIFYPKNEFNIYVSESAVVIHAQPVIPPMSKPR